MMKDVLTEKHAEKAYLALLDYRDLAKAEAYYRGKDDLTDSVKAEAVHWAEGDTITLKKSNAMKSDLVINHIKEVAKAREEYLILKYKHQLCTNTVEWWRTVQKSLISGT